MSYTVQPHRRSGHPLLNTMVAAQGPSLPHWGISPWNQHFTFQPSNLQTLTYGKVAIAFEMLYLVSLLVLLGLVLRKQPLKGTTPNILCKALVASLVANILASILHIVYLFFEVRQSTVKRSYVVMLMLESILQLSAYVTVFFVLYRLVARYLYRISSDGDERIFFLNLFHHLILAVLAVISAVKAALYITVLVQVVEKSYSQLTFYYINLSASQQILYWLASLEVLLCIAFVMIRVNILGFPSQTGLFSLAIAGFLFFGLNLFYGVVTILYNLGMREVPPSLTAAIPAVIQAICMIGTYSGIIRCCLHLNRKEHPSIMSTSHSFDDITIKPRVTTVLVGT